jgi:hypothetical protein
MEVTNLFNSIFDSAFSLNAIYQHWSIFTWGDIASGGDFDKVAHEIEFKGK